MEVRVEVRRVDGWVERLLARWRPSWVAIVHRLTSTAATVGQSGGAVSTQRLLETEKKRNLSYLVEVCPVHISHGPEGLH